MSIKRPLSPGSNGASYDDTRALKRFKLHAIIQELRNEEANLAMLKKLRACQLSATRTATTNNATVTSTNGFHPTATRMPTATSSSSSKISTPLPTNSSRASLQQPSMTVATRKMPNAAVSASLSSLVTTTSATKVPNSTSNKTSTSSISTTYSLEERKTQAKVALRKQLERELLNIPSPKPLLQDILFIPHLGSLEFQPYIGLEDVVQCLSELQNDRHRLPQRFTDRAQIDEPFVCDQCGTDFTIRWWEHPIKQAKIDENSSRSNTNILCDRCKKQAVRRTSKSEHSALLKNVFVSAMEQEKEIEKNFNALIRQHRAASRTSATAAASAKSTSSNRTQQPNTVTPTLPPPPLPAPTPPVAAYVHHHAPNNHHQHHHSAKTKSSLALNFATKLSQQPPAASRKSGVIVQPQLPPPQLTPAHTNHFRNLPHTKTPMPVVHHPSHSHFRSAPLSVPSPQAKSQPLGGGGGGKMPKSAIRQPVVSRPAVFHVGSNVPAMHAPVPAAATVRPTAAKRRTFPAN